MGNKCDNFPITLMSSAKGIYGESLHSLNTNALQENEFNNST